MGSRPEVCLVIARACVIALCVALLGLARAHGAEPAKPAKRAARPPVEDERGARELAEAGVKGDRASEDRMVKALAGSDRKARYAAIRSLGLVRSKAAVKRLEALAKSKDAGERELALEALARSGEPAAPSAACRAGDAAACQALQWADGEQAEPALREALRRPEPAARASAAFALARLGRREGLLEIVGSLLQDPAPAVRVEAAQAAAALGDRTLLPAIRAALEVEKDPLARQVLGSAAARLEGAR